MQYSVHVHLVENGLYLKSAWVARANPDSSNCGGQGNWHLSLSSPEGSCHFRLSTHATASGEHPSICRMPLRPSRPSLQEGRQLEGPAGGGGDHGAWGRGPVKIGDLPLHQQAQWTTSATIYMPCTYYHYTYFIIYYRLINMFVRWVKHNSVQ